MISRDKTSTCTVYMAVVRLKRRDAVLISLGVAVGVLLSVVISPSPQNCISLTKRMLFSSESNFNFSQLLQQNLQAPEETNFELRTPLFVAVVVPREPSVTASAVGSTWGSGLLDMELFTTRRLAGDLVTKTPLQLEWDDARLVYRVLALLYDRYTDRRYNWYMVVGDDAYVRVNAAVQVLANLNPEEPLFLRRDGMAKLKPGQKKLSLSSDRGCAPSTGILFSRGLLKLVAPAVEECLEDESTASWAVERKTDMERCVARKLGTRCLWSRELQVRHCGLGRGVWLVYE